MKYIVFSVLLFSFFILGCSKNDDTVAASAPVPLIQIKDLTQARSTSNSTFRFYINLNAANSKVVSVDYTTVDGTAKTNTDFVAKSGTITIDVNQSTPSFIDIEVKGDSLRQEDQQYYVQLSNPKNCTLGSITRATGTIINDGTYLPVDDAGYTTPDNYNGYHLAWSDEFNGKTLNNQDWSHELGGGGWGNNELENYTSSPKNLFFSQGKMIIEARKETLGTDSYTSARIVTKDKKTFQFGRIDIRAKLPVTKGIWPALWMLGNNISTTAWPACGEIDIMELVGLDPNKAYGTIHWGAAGGPSTHIGNNYTLANDDYSKKFHVFSLLWEEDNIKWYVDDILFFHASKQNVNGNYPFNNPFFFIMNVAVGGQWPGNPDATSVFPQRMFVDYVRVFQK